MKKILTFFTGALGLFLAVVIAIKLPLSDFVLFVYDHNESELFLPLKGIKYTSNAGFTEFSLGIIYFVILLVFFLNLNAFLQEKIGVFDDD